MAQGIRIAQPADLAWIHTALVETWGSARIVVNGDIVDATRHPCLIAGDNAGLLVFRDHRPDGVEIIAMEAFAANKGIGKQLLDHLIRESTERGKRYISATTTNDNLPALRFYQRAGFRVFDLRAGAIDLARERLKPEIPETGCEGIPIRDELELRYPL